jgi:hypothetical protein
MKNTKRRIKRREKRTVKGGGGLWFFSRTCPKISPDWSKFISDVKDKEEELKFIKNRAKDTITNLRKELETNKKNYEKLALELKNIKNKESEFIENIRILWKKAYQVNKDNKELKTQMNEYDKKIKEYEKEIENNTFLEQENVTLYAKNKELKEELKNIINTTVNLTDSNDELVKENKELVEKINEIKNDFSFWENELKAKTAELNTANTVIDKMSEQLLEQISTGVLSEEEKQTLKKHYESIIDGMEQKYKDTLTKHKEEITKHKLTNLTNPQHHRTIDNAQEINADAQEIECEIEIPREEITTKITNDNDAAFNNRLKAISAKLLKQNSNKNPIEKATGAITNATKVIDIIETLTVTPVQEIMKEAKKKSESQSTT